MAGYEYRMKSTFLITLAPPEVPGLVLTSSSPDEEYASFGYAQRNQLDAEARVGDDTQRLKSLRDLRSPEAMASVLASTHAQCLEGQTKRYRISWSRGGVLQLTRVMIDSSLLSSSRVSSSLPSYTAHNPQV